MKFGEVRPQVTQGVDQASSSSPINLRSVVELKLHLSSVFTRCVIRGATRRERRCQPPTCAADARACVWTTGGGDTLVCLLRTASSQL